MNKADQEILSILKEVFIPNKNALISPDGHFRYWMLKVLVLISVLGTLTILMLKLFGKDIPPNFGTLISMPVALFFGLLFIHINNRSENFSVLVFILTWASLFLGLYIGNA